MRRNPANRRQNKFFQTSRDELVALSRSGDEEAAAELIHRGRDPQTGLKTRGLASRFGKAVKNPSLRTSRQRKKMMRGVNVFHADHGISQKQKEYIVSRLRKSAPQGFFIKQINIPKSLGPVPNALYGPDAGDPPVREDQVYYASRGGRPVKDRLVQAAPRPWSYVQTIGIRDGEDFTIFTIYGGPLAPMHPEDSNNRDPEGSRKWWSQHALADGQWSANTNPRSRPKGRAVGFFREHPGGGYSGIRGAKSTDGRRERVRRRRAGREEIDAEMMEMRGESYRRKPSEGRRHGSQATPHTRDELVSMYFQEYDRSPEDQAILREMGFPYPEEVEANKGIRKGHIQALLVEMQNVQLPSDSDAWIPSGW